MVVAARPPEARPQFFVSQRRNEISELKTLFRSLPAETATRPENTEKRREMLKRLIAYMSMGIDVSSLFPDVVLSSATPDIVQKRLVSIYLNNYAESNPETAILVINAYQKDLLNADPRIRGLALKALSSLGVDSVEEYAREAVRQGLQDTSNYTRTLAVIGVNKLIYDSAVSSELVQKLDDFLDSTNDCTRESVDLQVLITTILVLMDIKGGELKLSKATIVHLFNRLGQATRFQKTVILHVLKTYVPQSDDELVGLLQTTEVHLSSATPSVVTSAVICMLSLVRQRHWLTQKPGWQSSPLALSVVRRVAPTLITLSAHSSILQLIYQLCTFSSEYCGVFSEHWVWLVPKFSDSDGEKILKLQILALFDDSMVLASVAAVTVIHAESGPVLAALIELFRSIFFKRCAHRCESAEKVMAEPRPADADLSESALSEGRQGDEPIATPLRSSEHADEDCETAVHQLLSWYSLEIPHVCSSLLPLIADIMRTHPKLQQYCCGVFASVDNYLDELDAAACEALLALCAMRPLHLDGKRITEFVLDKIRRSGNNLKAMHLLTPLLQNLLRIFLVFPSAVKAVLLQTLEYINARLTELPVDVVERYLMVTRLLGRERQVLLRVYAASAEGGDWLPENFVRTPPVTRFEDLDSLANPYATLAFGPSYEHTLSSEVPDSALSSAGPPPLGEKEVFCEPPPAGADALLLL